MFFYFLQMNESFATIKSIYVVLRILLSFKSNYYITL